MFRHPLNLKCVRPVKINTHSTHSDTTADVSSIAAGAFLRPGPTGESHTSSTRRIATAPDRARRRHPPPPRATWPDPPHATRLWPVRDRRAPATRPGGPPARSVPPGERARRGRGELGCRQPRRCGFAAAVKDKSGPFPGSCSLAATVANELSYWKTIVMRCCCRGFKNIRHK